MFFFKVDAVVCQNNGQFQVWELNIWQFIVIVEIKYFLNLNEYYLPIFILSIHFRQIQFFKITKDIKSNNNNKMNCELMLTYDTPALRQTGSRNLMGSKTLPTICRTYMKLVTKYQISAINSCWEKCDEKCAYMFNVYKNQLSWQTGSRNLTGPKTLPTIWHTYMKLVTKYQIPVINSCLEKCDEKWAYSAWNEG